MRVAFVYFSLRLLCRFDFALRSHSPPDRVGKVTNRFADAEHDEWPRESRDDRSGVLSKP
jgi:hypothetical protein